MKKCTLFALAILLLAGCERDFTFKGDFTPKIVVNSIINPDSTIVVDLLWSNRNDDKGDIKRVEGAEFSLYEDNVLLFDVVSADAAIEFNYHPRAGFKYTLYVGLDGHDKVSASTTVPDTPRFDDCEFIERYDREGGSVMYRASGVAAGGNTSAILLAPILEYEFEGRILTDADVRLYRKAQVNATAPFVDPFNKSTDTHGTSVLGFDFYADYLRVPPEYVEKTFPLDFIANLSSVYYQPDPEDLTNYAYLIPNHWINIIAASREYDMYYKTLYLYKDSTATPFPILFETYSVFSNVENGLGIFASYNSVGYHFEYENIYPNR